MDIDREKEGKCLTVTVPCYNSESYLERCVESLLKERDGLEIILTWPLTTTWKLCPS